MRRRVLSVLSLSVILAGSWIAGLPAQQPPPVAPSLFAEMKWRNIGPYRAGRTKAAAGHPSQPYTFYIGMVNGGVWKTTDAGRTWKPIFDDQPTGSIGWVAVAPSDPEHHLRRQRRRAAAAGSRGRRRHLQVHRRRQDLDAPRPARRAADSQDRRRSEQPEPPVRRRARPSVRPERGARHLPLDRRRPDFERVLFKDENTGGKDVDIDPSNPDIVYATMWEQRQGPWENGAWGGTNGGHLQVHRRRHDVEAADAGPAATASSTPSSPSRRAIRDGSTRRVEAGGGGTGIYRSDDAGRDVGARDDRHGGRPARINEVVPHVHPKDADTLIVTDIVSYKSTDGGKTFVPFKGAPGGDDNQNIWWNPDNPDIMLLVIDQGAVVTLNGGQTWSSWFTQPTAALYHVMTDNAFPYRVCGGQQDSGSVCVASRGNDGQITFRDWHPVGVEEYGYAAPDPLDPDLVYGGKVTRYDRRTGQVSDVGPVAGGRGGGAAGGPTLPHRAHAAGGVLDRRSARAVLRQQRAVEDARRRHQLEADQPRPHARDVGRAEERRHLRLARRRRERAARSARRSSTPSARPIADINRIWIGTDDGVIATTADGGLHWTDVTPPAADRVHEGLHRSIPAASIR